MGLTAQEKEKIREMTLEALSAKINAAGARPIPHNGAASWWTLNSDHVRLPSEVLSYSGPVYTNYGYRHSSKLSCMLSMDPDTTNPTVYLDLIYERERSEWQPYRKDMPNVPISPPEPVTKIDVSGDYPS